MKDKKNQQKEDKEKRCDICKKVLNDNENILCLECYNNLYTKR